MATMDKQILAATYPQHLETLRARYDDALAACGYDAVVIGAGAAALQFMDDQQVGVSPQQQQPQQQQAPLGMGGQLPQLEGEAVGNVEEAIGGAQGGILTRLRLSLAAMWS